MISNSEGGLQRLIDRLNEVAKSYKMKINVNVCMYVCCAYNAPCVIRPPVNPRCGRLFQMVGDVRVKVRCPMAERSPVGFVSCRLPSDRSWTCRPVLADEAVEVLGLLSAQHLVRDECNLVLEALSDRQPVQFPKDGRDVVAFSRTGNYTRQCVLHSLKLIDVLGGYTE